jgi:putative acetyltransferase
MNLMNLCPCKTHPAANTEIPAIKKVIFSVLMEYGLKPSESGKDSDLNDIVENYFNANGFFGIVMDGDKNIVGTFGIYRLDTDVCELRKMYVLKKFRGMGCGKMILDFVIDLARKHHYKKIRLETITVLTEAVRLYKKYGFIEIKPTEINDRVDQAFELSLE